MKINSGFIIQSLLVVALFLIAGTGYYLYSSHIPTPVVTTPLKAIQVSNALTQAKTNLSQATDKLDQMIVASPSEISFSGIADGYSVSENAVKNQTDFLFKNPQTPEPQFQIKVDPDVQKEIDSERLNITNVLIEWKYLVDITSGKTPTTVQIQTAQTYADDVQNYVNQLQTIVNTLTPENSNLTQSQINTYQEITASVVQGVNVVTATFIPVDVSINNTTMDTTTPTTQDSVSSNPVVPVQQFTPQQIQTQQDIVNQYQTQVDTLQTEFIQQDTASPVFTSTTSTTSDTFDTATISSSSSEQSSITPTDNSGAPQLIEGANPIN